MYKMLIADDEPAVRQYLHFIVKQYNLPFLICGEAEDGEQAVQMVTPISLIFLFWILTCLCGMAWMPLNSSGKRTGMQ